MGEGRSKTRRMWARNNSHTDFSVPNFLCFWITVVTFLSIYQIETNEKRWCGLLSILCEKHWRRSGLAQEMVITLSNRPIYMYLLTHTTIVSRVTSYATTTNWQQLSTVIQKRIQYRRSKLNLCQQTMYQHRKVNINVQHLATYLCTGQVSSYLFKTHLEKVFKLCFY